jgi:hypothetical protein
LDEPYSENILGFCFNDEFGKTMNKIELIGVLKDECSLPKQEAAKIVGLFIGEMTKALAKELGKFNVNVNCVAPGMVMTEMARNIPPEFLNMAVDETVLGRIASSEDCANVVVFLCSDRSRHITGEVIKVDGGLAI